MVCCCCCCRGDGSGDGGAEVVVSGEGDGGGVGRKCGSAAALKVLGSGEAETCAGNGFFVFVVVADALVDNNGRGGYEVVGVIP